MTLITVTGILGVLAVVVIMACVAYWPSHKRGKHIIQLTQTEEEVAPEYGWVTRDIRNRSYEPFADDYRNWRTQTFDSLSPEALDSTSNDW